MSALATKLAVSLASTSPQILLYVCAGVQLRAYMCMRVCFVCVVCKHGGQRSNSGAVALELTIHLVISRVSGWLGIYQVGQTDQPESSGGCVSLCFPSTGYHKHVPPCVVLFPMTSGDQNGSLGSHCKHFTDQAIAQPFFISLY